MEPRVKGYEGGVEVYESGKVRVAEGVDRADKVRRFPTLCEAHFARLRVLSHFHTFSPFHHLTFTLSHQRMRTTWKSSL
jgi:hypothetical protein